jgi:hypothetical protein
LNLVADLGIRNAGSSQSVRNDSSMAVDRSHLAVYGSSGAKFTDTAWNILKTQSLP